MYTNNISKKTPPRHSIELEKQYFLKKKYQDNLNKYHKTALTPGSYESQNRPNSVTRSIKLRKSHDSSHAFIKNSQLEMYGKEHISSSKNSLRKSEK